MRKITKRAGVIIGVAALGISGGVAWAVWSITGTATATATAAEAKPVVITGAGLQGLFPGGTKPLSIKSTNPNEFPVADYRHRRDAVDFHDKSRLPGFERGLPAAAVNPGASSRANTTQTVEGRRSMIDRRTGCVPGRDLHDHGEHLGRQHPNLSLAVGRWFDRPTSTFRASP